MIEILENDKENIQNESTIYNCSDDIYGILLKTGKYINAKDNNHQIMKILFLINIIINR